MKINQKQLQTISLFSGALGLDLGLEKAGFRTAVAVECDRHAADTVKLNHPKLPLLQSRIEDLSTKEILAAAKLKVGEAAVVVGGPSCQAFSTAGQRGSLGDPRGELFRHFIRIVEEAQPRFFIMENVRGLLSAAIKHRSLKERGPGYPSLAPEEMLGSALEVVISELKQTGYYVTFELMNAADYGVSQVRHRLVFIGSRDGETVAMPRKTHSQSGGKGMKPWQTLRQTLKGLDDKKPEFSKFSDSRLKYLNHISEGGNWRDLPDDLKEAALGKAYVSWGGRSGFLRRLSWDKPSPALTTQPDGKATMLCHPTELRPLSVREYARIQQFADEWQFVGSLRRKYIQLGNAVPVGLGLAIGKALMETIKFRKHCNKSKLGKVECFDVDLLSKLSQRPATIVNPPRMRETDCVKKLATWYDETPRLRASVLKYAAPEIKDALATTLAEKKRKKSGKKAAVKKDPGKKVRKPIQTLPKAAIKSRLKHGGRTKPRAASGR